MDYSVYSSYLPLREGTVCQIALALAGLLFEAAFDCLCINSIAVFLGRIYWGTLINKSVV